MPAHMSIYIAEVFGTAMLMILGLGVCANISLRRSGCHGGGALMAAIGWGMSMTAVAVMIAPVSGAHCNPAVTIGFWLAGKVDTALVPGYFISEIIGAFIGAVVVWVIYKDHLDEEENPAAKLGVFATGPSLRNPFRNMLAETVATFALMITLLSLGHIQPANGVALFFVFIAVAGGVMSFGGLTGYAINPVRDFLPRLAHAILPIKGKGTSDWGYAWVPVVGPIFGAILAAYLYRVIF